MPKPRARISTSAALPCGAEFAAVPVPAPPQKVARPPSQAAGKLPDHETYRYSDYPPLPGQLFGSGN
jgi:hypothetical protein